MMRHGAAKSLLKKLAACYGFAAVLPFMLRRPAIAAPQHVGHSQWLGYLAEHFNKPGMRILEIGSRNVTGANLRGLFPQAQYVGFDYYAGENVDVVGDAHRLSTYFAAGEQFDLIFSSAVFEHLAMPWVVAQEIAKLLKVGGHVFVETHFSFSAHELPWHFFQFSHHGLRVLFNEALGFDLVESGMSNPMAGYYTSKADRYLRYRPVTELYCHSEILCRKRTEVTNFTWDRLSTQQVAEGLYPPA